MSTITIHPAIYVVLGYPGSGKGTFAETLKDYDHISTGHIIRQEVKNSTSFGLRYEEALKKNIVMGIPCVEMQDLVGKRLEKALSEQKGVILDGYPKSLQQCDYLDAFIARKGLEDRVVFVLLDITEKDAVDRIGNRLTCKKCNKIYNSQFSPPKVDSKCDECPGTLKKRAADNPKETIRRIQAFKERMGPVINHYSHHPRFYIIDAKGSLATCSERFESFHYTCLAKNL